MNRVLLDTNAYTAFLNGDEQVLDALSSANKVYMSIFVLGELHSGFRGGSKMKSNMDTLNLFLSKSSVEIVPGTLETASIFGEIKNQLKKVGSPIPINDVWIAAHSLETASVLITYDHHFSHILGLRLWH